jgi:hypothetical protein
MNGMCDQPYRPVDRMHTGQGWANKDQHRYIQNSGSRLIMSEKAVTSGLVDRQQDAVRHTSGPLPILAGAGTGKTATITTKIAYMVQELGIASDAT